MFFAHPRHVSEYLKVQERDPKAHKFLGQLYEREGDINKAVGCYKVKNNVSSNGTKCFLKKLLLTERNRTMWIISLQKLHVMLLRARLVIHENLIVK